MKTKKLSVSIILLSAALFAGCENGPSTSDAIKNNTIKQESMHNTVVNLNSTLINASGFAILAGTTLTNDGASFVTGDIGVSPGTAITGFQPSPFNTISGPGTVTSGLGLVTGIIYAGGPVAAQAHVDAITAYNYLVSQTPDTTYLGVTQLDGLTFKPGVYRFSPSANLMVNGTVYLDFQGNNDALFIFQLGSTLVTMTGSNVVALNNNNQNCTGSNVYWTVGSSATIDGSQFLGTIIATTTITMVSGVNVDGRLWAINGAVTMISDTVSVCGATSVDPVPIEIASDFVTGGGWINGSYGGKATFGVSGGIKNSKLWGQLSFEDHGKINSIKLKSESVTSYIVIDAFTRQIEGITNINGSGTFSYKVIVTDNGEPGRDDLFSIEVSNGYSASGTLKGGNIQLHTK